MCRIGVMFEQFLQLGALSYVQIESVHVGGVNEWWRALPHPTAPGYSTAIHSATVANHAYPDGPVWQGLCDWLITRSRSHRR